MLSNNTYTIGKEVRFTGHSQTRIKPPLFTFQNKNVIETPYRWAGGNLVDWQLPTNN